MGCEIPACAGMTERVTRAPFAIAAGARTLAGDGGAVAGLPPTGAGVAGVEWPTMAHFGAQFWGRSRGVHA